MRMYAKVQGVSLHWLACLLVLLLLWLRTSCGRGVGWLVGSTESVLMDGAHAVCIVAAGVSRSGLAHCRIE